MQYQMFYNAQGERLWLPLLAGAAIITAPFWLGGRQCCGNQNNYNNQPGYPGAYPYPYPYPQPQPIPQPVPYPYPYPYPYPIG